MQGTVVGTVASVLRFPVKSMLGEALKSASLDARGLEGDRRFALIDVETGKVVSVKRPRRWLRIFELRATTHRHGVEITFPDGRRVDINDDRTARDLSAFLGREVIVSDDPPADATFEESWVRELKHGAEPYFGAPSRDDGDDTDLVDAGTFMGPNQNFFNFGSIHAVTSGTTNQLARLAPESRFDAHRFRPNLVIGTDETGFVESSWQGRTLRIGDVRLAVSFTVPRCVMTTLPQDDLLADPNVLRTITEHNAVDCFGTGTAYPCVGVYADVVDGGVIGAGDPVVLEH